MNLCACGCGQLVFQKSKYYHTKYIIGHNNQDKLIKHSGQFKKGESYWLGKNHSPETKQKISLSKRGSIPWNKGLKGIYKTPHSEETKRKIGVANSIALKGKTLSEETKNKLRIRFSGKNNPAWKGGITLENKRLRRLFQKNLAPLILKRDNYTCSLCGNIGVELHVDHIKSWSKYPNIRFEIKNCRTDRKIPQNVESWGRNLLYLERRGLL